MILTLIIIYIVTLVYLSITERYRNFAMLVGLQGAVLFAVALLRLHALNIWELLFVAVETIVFKAVIVPGMLLRIIRRTGINRIAPFGITLFNSLVISLAALVASVWVTLYAADNTVDRIFFGVALYALLSGLILIITRRRIFSHLVGFLVIENGVFLFSMAIGSEMPFLINIAVLLDLLFSTLMLGLMLSRIGVQMHAVDADTLTRLKD